MKHRIQNSDDRIQPRHGMSGCVWTRKFENGGGERDLRPRRGEFCPGGGGKRWFGSGKRGEKMAKGSRFSRLFPAFPGISRLFPLSFFLSEMNMKIRPTPCPLPNWEGGVYWAIIPRASLADLLCPGLLSVAPMGLSIAALRAVDRIYAEKSSDCCAKVRDVSRKFAQIRAVIPRCYALLRVGAVLKTTSALFSAKTLRAAGLLTVAGVGSVVTARCGDAPTSPPWPQPKSLAAAFLGVFKKAPAFF
jgi:hypothetical protein